MMNVVSHAYNNSVSQFKDVSNYLFEYKSIKC